MNRLKQRFIIQTYNVGIVLKPLGDVFERGLEAGDINWVKHKYRDRFFADPFLIKEDDQNYYILCEEFVFWEDKGKISLLVISKKSFELVSRKTIIEEQYHLSFPFCRLNGHCIIPEACRSGRMLRYDIDDSFNIVGKEVLVNEGLIDSVFVENNGITWMYTAKSRIPSSELYCYKQCGSSFIPYPAEPIEIDNERTRSAGSFFSFQNNLYRPVQDCSGRYGRQTKIMRVDSLGSDGYKAEEVITINSLENPPYNETLHTFNVYDKCIVVDGSKDYLRFPLKIAYKKLPRLCRVINTVREKNEHKRAN